MARTIEPKLVEMVEHVEWYALRHGEIWEAEAPDGRLRYRVQIRDEGRDAFVTQWFNDLAPALDFLEGVKNENERHHQIRR